MIFNNKILLNYDDILNTYKSKEHGIEALSKYTNWFPIKASPALAGIAADLIGDGHLQDLPKSRLDYTSKSIDELLRFNKEIYNLFGLKGKIRNCTTNKYNTKNLGVNNKPLGRILKEIGVPVGPKVLTCFSVPRWILKDKTIFARFVNRLYSCEGNVDLHSKCIEFRMHKSLALIRDGISFFQEIKNHLEKYFSIKTTKPFLNGRYNTRKDGIKTVGIRLKIKNKESLIKFRRFIGFENKIKRNRLDKIIENNLK